MLKSTTAQSLPSTPASPGYNSDQNMVFAIAVAFAILGIILFMSYDKNRKCGNDEHMVVSPLSAQILRTRNLDSTTKMDIVRAPTRASKIAMANAKINAVNNAVNSAILTKNNIAAQQAQIDAIYEPVSAALVELRAAMVPIGGVLGRNNLSSNGVYFYIYENLDPKDGGVASQKAQIALAKYSALFNKASATAPKIDFIAKNAAEQTIAEAPAKIAALQSIIKLIQSYR